MSEAPERIRAFIGDFVEPPDIVAFAHETGDTYGVEYIREDIHAARIKELEDVLSWYEQIVREFATATDQRADQAEIALDSDRGKLARDTLAKQRKGKNNTNE